MFVSQRDIVQIMVKSIDADPNLKFGIYSNNDYRWVDIDQAREDIGSEPEDRAENDHTY